MSYAQSEHPVMTNEDWQLRMQKSHDEAQAWLIKYQEPLKKLDEWLKTEVKIGNTSTNTYYDGNIRALINALFGQWFYFCAFIQKRIKEGQLNVGDVERLINDTVFPYEVVKTMNTFDESIKRGMEIASITSGDEVTKQNLLTLCTKINELNEDDLKELQGILCDKNKGEWNTCNLTAWGQLVKAEKAEREQNKGGRKLTRRRKSNPKTKSKQKHKRRSYKKSSHRR
jgi:hypothetical protein